MENDWDRKQKRLIRITGITLAVYLVFRYIMPLVIPFLIAYLLALFLRPAVNYLNRNLRVRNSVGAVVITAAFMILVFGLIYLLGFVLLRQLTDFLAQLPGYMESIDRETRVFCQTWERRLDLRDGVLIDWVCNQCDQMVEQIGAQAASGAMGKSIGLIKWLINVGAVCIVVFLGTIFCITSYERITEMRQKTIFRDEIRVITGRIAEVGGAFLRTQLVIMAATSVICSLGLTLIGSAYGVLAGVLIGLLDALPLFGTGTVFVPWMLICLFRGNYMKALFLLVIYLICYFLREILEAKMMGKSVGLGTLEALIAMYVGLRLFGIAGVLAGPIGFILIQEIDRLWGREKFGKKT